MDDKLASKRRLIPSQDGAVATAADLLDLLNAVPEKDVWLADRDGGSLTFLVPRLWIDRTRLRPRTPWQVPGGRSEATAAGYFAHDPRSPGPLEPGWYQPWAT